LLTENSTQKPSTMKKAVLALTVLFSFTLLHAQEPAVAGTVYGTLGDNGKTVAVDQLENSFVKNKYTGKITGKVVEVCQEMGCWINLEKPDGSTVLAKAKDHGFTMPKDIVGKTVVVEGEASLKKISEAQRRHYAEDAGKSKEDIEKIKGASREITIVASGVKVL
jgi:hypothetical protein